MSKTIEARTYEEALAWLRDHGFDTTDAPGTNGRVFLRKYNVSAAIQKTPEDGVKIFAYPGYLIGSEISKLVNRGYQQRNFEAGQPRLSAVPEDFEDRSAG